MARLNVVTGEQRYRDYFDRSLDLSVRLLVAAFLLLAGGIWLRRREAR